MTRKKFGQFSGNADANDKLAKQIKKLLAQRGFHFIVLFGPPQTGKDTVIRTITEKLETFYFYTNESCPNEAEIVFLSELVEYSNLDLSKAIELCKTKGIPLICTSTTSGCKPWKSQEVFAQAKEKKQVLEQSLGVQVFDFMFPFDPHLSSERLWEISNDMAAQRRASMPDPDSEESRQALVSIVHAYFEPYVRNVFGLDSDEAKDLWDLSQQSKANLFGALSKIMGINLTP